MPIILDEIQKLHLLQHLFFQLFSRVILMNIFTCKEAKKNQIKYCLHSLIDTKYYQHILITIYNNYICQITIYGTIFLFQLIEVLSDLDIGRFVSFRYATTDAIHTYYLIFNLLV